VSLQVAERAVVAEHVETIGRPLEGAPRTMTPVQALADVCREHRVALVRRHAPSDLEQLGVGAARDGIERSRDHLRLAVRIVVGQRDFFSRAPGVRA
jgi:hypothetical protein